MPESKNSPIRVSLDLALSGKGAIPRAGYDKALADANHALDWLRGQRGTLELLGIPSRTDDLKAAAKLAAGIKGMKTVAVLGIGGSSLGGQALTALRRVTVPYVEFHDNPDPFSWTAALKRFDLKKTHFIAISKSGGTAETLMQVLTAAEALEKAGARSLKKHFTIITEPHASPLAD
ncbi:MAG: glucose-6-phosphate isomerase, partial [Rhizomicrobium sp.]